IDYYGPIIGNISGKRIIDKNRGKSKTDFYESVVDAINKFQDIQTIILAGPGFGKGDFWDYISQKHKDIAKKIIVEDTGTGGRVGVQEILKKGIVDKVTSENRIAIETAAVNEILSEIAKSASTQNNVIYGKKEVINAANLGAVEKLLVIDIFVREAEVEAIMDLVENMSGEVMVISTEHDAGEQLKALGGLAAKLRYAIN
ncbi:MAG: mRNA surveillance protein pelota, partial [Methanobacteriaceae archaeon]